MIWSLPEGDADFPGRWYAIKVAFSKSLPPVAPPSRVRLRPGERGIWQRRYWEHTIRDDRDYWQQVETYMSDHSEAVFTHGICPDCYEKFMKVELQELRKPK